MPTYTVAVVMVDDAQWVAIFESMIRVRKWLREHYGLPMTTEIKGSQLAKGTGPWRKLNLSAADRHEVYRVFMHFQDHHAPAIKTFAVVVWKAYCSQTRGARAVGWQYAFERVETFTRKGTSRVMLFPDAGQYAWIRSLARKMRRFAPVPSAWGTDPLRRDLLNILVDDPVERDSEQSYMIQLADLNAYAAFRNRVPIPAFPRDMWLELGAAIEKDANWIEATKNRGATRGIKDAP